MYRTCRHLALVVAASIVASGCASREVAVAPDRPAPRSLDTPDPVVARPIDQAIADGVAFLVSAQNPDGSWGTGLQTRGLEIFHSVPGSHHAFRVGTTGLAVMALREAIEAERNAGREPAADVVSAAERGMRYLIASRDARREDGTTLYNIWAHVYALQALSMELRGNPGNAAAREAAEWNLDRLGRYEAFNGGWNYYDFNAQTQRPSLEATSFGSAAALVAIHEARAAGVEPADPDIVRRAVRRIEECRMPGGWFLYGADSRYIPDMPANQPKGAAGRTQSCNDALWLWGSPLVGRSQVIDGLRMLFEHHDWLSMARKRPYPHEAWYQNSGYYYYFGHFYASRLIERLDGVERADFARQLADKILPFQESDGSWWDYAMWDYHKPYGTAYAVMALLRCKAAGGG